MEEDKRDKIEQFLDIASEPVKKEVTSIDMPDTLPVSHVQDDYEYSRHALREILNQGMQLFASAKDVAESSQSPNDFNAASNLLGALSAATERMLALSERHHKVTGAKTQEEKTVTNNTMNIKMTSSEFLKMVKGARNGETS